MYLSKNLKHLRRKNNRQTQEELAQSLEVTRSVVSAYEDGRAEPNIATLTRMSKYFNVSIDSLTNLDLANVDEKQVEYQREIEKYATARNLKIQSIVVDNHKQHSISLVPKKAAAGYTTGHADVEYINDLPIYQLPYVSAGKEYRAFEIIGDSMLPLQPESIVIGEKIEEINDVKDGQICIVVSKNEGIVLKKVYNKIKDRNTLLLKSANVAYAPYELSADEVLEVWKFNSFISQDFPKEYDPVYDLKQAFARMEYELQEIKMKKATE